MKSYHGSCHCGRVKFAFQTPEITKVMRCDCSICVRKGITLTPDAIPPDLITINAADDALRCYQFGTMTARHHFCSVCGIHTFVEIRLNPDKYRVNLGCVDDLDTLRLPEEIFPGKNL